MGHMKELLFEMNEAINDLFLDIIYENTGDKYRSLNNIDMIKQLRQDGYALQMTTNDFCNGNKEINISLLRYGFIIDTKSLYINLVIE